MQFKLFSIPATADAEAEEEPNRFLRSHRVVSVQKELVQGGQTAYRVFPQHVRLAARSRKRFCRKMNAYHGNYTSGRWSEDETARHVEPLLAFVRRAESDVFRRRVIESIEGSCPKEARTA